MGRLIVEVEVGLFRGDLNGLSGGGEGLGDYVEDEGGDVWLGLVVVN